MWFLLALVVFGLKRGDPRLGCLMRRLGLCDIRSASCFDTTPTKLSHGMPDTPAMFLIAQVRRVKDKTVTLLGLIEFQLERRNMAPHNVRSDLCSNPNYFSSVLAPAVERRLPERGSLSAGVVDYLTHAGPFFQTVSQDLCDDGRMGLSSFQSATKFITRSGTTAAVAVGTAGLAVTGAVVGSWTAAVGLGVAGLAILPYVAERVVFGVADAAGELLNGVKRRND